MLKHAIGGAAALLLVTTALARADADPQAIWSDWQTTYARFGGTLEAASEDVADGTLTLEGVTLTMAPDEGEPLAVGTITMAEQPDGSVRIALPERIEAQARVEEDGLTLVQDLTFAQDGLEIVVTEAGGERAYAITADGLTLGVAQAPAGDEGAAAGGDAAEGSGAAEAVPPTDVTLTLSDVASTYRSGLGGEPGAFAQDGTAATARIAIAAEGPDPVTLTHEMEAVALDVSGAYGPAPEGPVRGLSEAGITYDGTFSHAGSTLSGEGTGGGVDYALAGTSEAARTSVLLDGERLAYAVTSTAPTLRVEAASLPAPVELSLAEVATTFALPVGAGGEVRPFGLSVALRDLVASDAAWAAFDPTGQLPRDPATLVIDIDGTAAMEADLLGDPEALAALDGPPGRLVSLDLSELTLVLAGAALRGSGSLTFPEEGPAFEPVGTITLALDGSFALLDRLVALGVLPAEQVAFVKGMTGAVARSVGEDQLESVIEFTEGGGIRANGLPLR